MPAISAARSPAHLAGLLLPPLVIRTGKGLRPVPALTLLATVFAVTFVVELPDKSLVASRESRVASRCSRLGGSAPGPSHGLSGWASCCLPLVIRTGKGLRPVPALTLLATV